MRSSIAVLLAATFAVLTVGALAADAQKAEEELRALGAKVPAFEAVTIPAGAENVTIAAEDGLTIDALRGVRLDEGPPELGEPAGEYAEKMTDSYAPGEAPYIADKIAPFRFEYFDNEFSYGGWHNWAMCDYACAHGFNVLSSYNHRPADWTHVPENTKWLRWGGLVNWDRWMKEHEIGEGRYDRLADMQLVEMLREEERLQYDPQYDYLMIDMEHGLLGPEKLREQQWYPADADEAEREEFERKYYAGYAKTYTAPVRAARENGYGNISVYGWQPFARTWWGLEKVTLGPETYWRWNAFGKDIYEAIDILNPSVYCFYWSAKNVAYTLANVDLNMRLIEGMVRRKPVHPYYWTLLHGGGGGKRWWKGQPIPNEDVRAMTALCFFTGCEGMVLWNWSGTGNHHRPAIKRGEYVMVGEAFELAPAEADDDAKTHHFARYDVLHISEVTDGTARFQLVQKDNTGDKYGLTPEHPIYALAADELGRYLRPKSEPVSALIEGLALVKPLEYMLSHGEVKIDVSAQEQYAQVLPIVRRVTLGRYHIIGTYDPKCVSGGEGREIRLDDFAGKTGRTLVLPADGEFRIFVLREGT